MNPKAEATPKHDGQIILAIGHSRKDTKWKNTTLLWSQLLDKLSVTTRTRETQADYDKMAKAEQDAIKDVGGFVGGSLKRGRRKADSLAWRHILTLDADFAPADLWGEVTLLNSYACCVYSTHKHRPEKSRLRFVAPLKRPVAPDEYQALARRVAADLGSVDWWDDTTYEPERLMYWPSTSADAEYVFQSQDGAWLDPDEVLASYGPEDAWKDPCNWPESSRTKQQRRKMADKQGDPLTKPGLIGAFCRVYDIASAIETFLADVYEPAAAEGRFTYLKGSTAGGLVLYDEGKFAYSHHGTDPISGRLCNAWDLVRIHKFGHLDEDIDPDAPLSKWPSQVAMESLSLSDDPVKKELADSQIADAQTEFSDIIDDDWKLKLQRERKGKLLANAHNVVLILSNDPKIAGKITTDAFSHRITVTGDLPWRKAAQSIHWTDGDDGALRNWFSRVYGITGKGVILDALSEVLFRNTFHPVRKYLEGLFWDGELRVETVLIDYLGAADNPYTRAVTRTMLVAAVARVMDPGVKFDNMLVMVGRQGEGKSFLLKKLGRDWFSDSLTTVQGKEAYEALQGKWILEMGELAALRKSEVEYIKLFLSKQIDSFRVSYGRNISDFPRQCVFFGSTNHSEFLRDATGNRRFWPVETWQQAPTKSVFNDLTEEEVDQIWAEAVQLYEKGTPLFLSREIIDLAIEAQEEHMEESDKIGQVQWFLDVKLPENWAALDRYQRRQYIQEAESNETTGGAVERSRVCAMEIWLECFGGDPKMFDMLKSREIKDIMRRIKGWEATRGKIRFGKFYGVQRGYVRST